MRPCCTHTALPTVPKPARAGLPLSTARGSIARPLHRPAVVAPALPTLTAVATAAPATYSCPPATDTLPAPETEAAPPRTTAAATANVAPASRATEQCTRLSPAGPTPGPSFEKNPAAHLLP